MDGMNGTNGMNGMNGMNQSTNPYEQANREYQNRTAQPPQKKKNKIPGMVLLILGAVFLLIGIAIVFVGGNTDMLESENPIDIFQATETDQYVFTAVQYMTDPVAYYEAMENMQFYIVCDSDWYPCVICLHTDELEAFQPYIDWLYSESYDNEPEEMWITGYAQPFDAELAELVIEGFVDNFGDGIVDETNFTEWFGEYYLQVGQKNSAFGLSNVGIFILLLAVVLLVIGGALLYEKPAYMSSAYANGPVIQENNIGLGILGALLGALVGGLAWTIVGVLGFVSGWIGALIVFCAFRGYAILSHREDRAGLIISIIFWRATSG